MAEGAWQGAARGTAALTNSAMQMNRDILQERQQESSQNIASKGMKLQEDRAAIENPGILAEAQRKQMETEQMARKEKFYKSPFDPNVDPSIDHIAGGDKSLKDFLVAHYSKYKDESGSLTQESKARGTADLMLQHDLQVKVLELKDVDTVKQYEKAMKVLNDPNANAADKQQAQKDVAEAVEKHSKTQATTAEIMQRKAVSDKELKPILDKMKKDPSGGWKQLQPKTRFAIELAASSGDPAAFTKTVQGLTQVDEKLAQLLQVAGLKAASAADRQENKHNWTVTGTTEDGKGSILTDSNTGEQKVVPVPTGGKVMPKPGTKKEGKENRTEKAKEAATGGKNVVKDLPDASKLADGTTAKDPATGKVVKVVKGGKWVEP